LTTAFSIAHKVLLTASHICFHQKYATLAYVLEVTVIHSHVSKQTCTVTPLVVLAVVSYLGHSKRF